MGRRWSKADHREWVSALLMNASLPRSNPEYKDTPMDIAQLPHLPEKTSESSETSDSESDSKDTSGITGIPPSPCSALTACLSKCEGWAVAEAAIRAEPRFHRIQRHKSHQVDTASFSAHVCLRTTTYICVHICVYTHTYMVSIHACVPCTYKHMHVYKLHVHKYTERETD